MEKTKISAATFSAKYKSKREIWFFLTVDFKAYLPSYETVTIYHLKDLVSGKKKVIKSTAIKHLQVPQYEGLQIKHLLEQAKMSQEILDRLPCEKEIKKLPKQYIINIIYTIVGQQFAEWVKVIVDQRHQHIKDKRDLMIEVDPEIAAAFNASNAVSV